MNEFRTALCSNARKELQLFVCSKIFLYVCDIETIKECLLCLE